MELSFKLIDDSELDCFIARKIISHASKTLKVATFQNGRLVLDLITADKEAPGILTVILLDLQMPVMSGFEFIEEFEKLPVEIKNKYVIVILSSTRNANDIFRVLAYGCVHSLIEKPLTREKLFELLMELQALQ